MKLHHLAFAGGLAEATAHLNANGLAVFDVVATRVVHRRQPNPHDTTEVVLRVPDDFDEARWGQADEGLREAYREELTGVVCEFRQGKVA